MTERQAGELDAKLVLIPANHIGDPEVPAEAIALAKDWAGGIGFPLVIPRSAPISAWRE